MNKKRFLLTILLLTSSAVHLLGRPITVESADGTQFKVEEGILKTSKVLENMLEDCDGSSGEAYLGKSAEEFQLILPFLESIHASRDDILGQLSEKEPLEMARIIELANFFDVQQIIDHGGNELKDRLDALCRQNQGNLDGALQSFLESMEPLSPEMNQLIAGKIIKKHLAKTWLLNKCTISSETLQNVIGIGAFSPNGNYFATGFGDGTAKIWNVETGQCVHTLTGHTGEIYSVVFSPNGTYLATGSDDGTAKIWNVETGQCVHTLTGHTNWILSVVFSPNGAYLATGSGDGTAEIWNVETGQCVHTLTGHTDRIVSVIFSPNGNYLATGSWDYTAKIWNVETGQCVRTLTGHRGVIWSVAFSPKGDYLATGSNDGTAKIWNIGCLDKLERSLSNDITLGQELMLILFYKNKDNETFRCPKYLAKDFESLPENILTLLLGNIEKNVRFVKKTIDKYNTII